MRETPEEGTKFGRWAFVKPMRAPGRRLLWLCKCECGTERLVQPADLATGKTKSCGCLNREASKQRATIHGGRGTKLNGVWANIRARCTNPKHISWKHYGGRGIKVCPEWDSFAAFREWALAAGYVEGATYRQEIDRTNNEGDYSPDNCQIVLPRANRQHTRASRNVTAFGETKSMAAWADDERCAVSYFTLRTRLQRGWSHRDALTAPAGSHRQR